MNGQVALKEVNVADALSIGEQTVSLFRNSLPSGFHAEISCPVKTMEQLKHGIIVGGNTAFDMEAIFLHLLMVKLQQEIELESAFHYDLCAVPSSLIDEYGCLRRDNKAVLASRLSVLHQNTVAPDIIVVDAQQLLYHITWPQVVMSLC